MSAEKVSFESLLPSALRISVSVLLLALAVTAVLHLDFQQPFIGYGLGGAFLLFLAAKPEPLRIVIVCMLGLAITIQAVGRHFLGLPTLLVQGMGSFGVASLLLLALAVLWKGRTREAASYRALLPGGVLTFLILGAQYSLNMASLLHARTYDLYAYVFDGALGFQPSFLAGRVVDSSPWIFPLVKITYEGIVLAMAALYAAFMSRREKPVWEVIELIFAPAMVGYLFFSIFPVCGPHYAFPLDFPKAYLPYSALHRLALESIPVLPAFPRNGVPSLHMTWALMIWLNTRGLPRWARVTAAALAIVTVFDTLATGEHYLFDLVVSLPFTLSMQAIMVRTVKLREPQRWLPAVTGCVMFLGWLILGRFGLHWMLASRFLIWSLVVVSSAVSLVWAVRLPALISEMQVQPRLQSRAMAAHAAG